MFNQPVILAAIISLLFSGGSASGCRTKQSAKSQVNTPPMPQTETGKSGIGELKALAEGFHSSITNPFVAVIRGEETYSSLMKLEPTLPKLGGDFFKSNVVIAAFLGQRNTGGYSLEIDRQPNGGVLVSEKAPGKGVMVPQMITYPFKLVSLPTSGTAAVPLLLGERLQQQAQLYRVTRGGEFTVSGGFTGGNESFPVVGKLQVMRLGDLITIGFALISSGTSRERAFRDSATTVMKDNRFTIDRLSRGSLLDPPSGNLHVSGTFVENNRLSLEIGSAPLNIPENYSGKGTVEAEIVKPQPD